MSSLNPPLLYYQKMKFAFLPLLIMMFVALIPAQNGNKVSDSRKTKKDVPLPEVEEALRGFNFSKLSINPNNLRLEDISKLETDFMPTIKSYLIKEGETVERLQRLAEPVFLLHRAGKSRTVVFESKIPTVFTWKETFVIFSTAAMDILSDKEITALVAHEIGHLYFAEEFAQAARVNNDRRLRIIELKCDLVALETLSKLKIKPSKLISAVERLIEERTKLKVESFQSGSPSLADRQELSENYSKEN